MAETNEPVADEQPQCLICLESVRRDDAVCLRCCQLNPSSTNALCADCAHLLVQTGSISGFGRCPLCKVFFRLCGDPTATGNTGVPVIEVCRDVGQCRCCQQGRVIVDRSMCAACLIGVIHPLLYECERCRGVQRIPHPMWRYQELPTSFTTDTWFCGNCGAYSHWRLRPEAVSMVPADDVPASWRA
jgi:hypothetical protein